MKVEILRSPETVVCFAASSAATTSPRFSTQQSAGALVLVGHTGGATQVAWYASGTQEGTPRQIYANGAALTTAVTVGGFPVPDELFAAPFVVPVVAGGTSCAMTIHKKG